MIDSHLHLQDAAFDADRAQALAQARAAGVAAWAVNGTSPEDWPRVANLARHETGIIPCYGLHPWQVNTWQSRDWRSPLAEYLQDKRATIGEIGLDRWIPDHDLDAQVTALRFQLELAHDLARPVSIHCLRAWDPLADELQRVTPLPRGFLIHGYGGPADRVRDFLRLGGVLSFSGAVLDERKTRMRQALCVVPSHCLLIETDAPDMPPPPAYRVEPQITVANRYRNEPANLPRILVGIARLRQEDPAILQAQLAENGSQFWEGFP